MEAYGAFFKAFVHENTTMRSAMVRSLNLLCINYPQCHINIGMDEVSKIDWSLFVCEKLSQRLKYIILKDISNIIKSPMP